MKAFILNIVSQPDIIIDYIQDNAGSDHPFFMYCAFNAPHNPRQSPKEFVEQYSLESIPLPGNFLPEHPLNNQIGRIQKALKNSGMEKIC